MKRNIQLYIGGSPVDLDSDSLILYNYTAEQLSNPTIVKNEYSQQITIPGTANNNRLFGEIFKLDRRQLYTADRMITGAYFNASKKTPFVIYEDAEIVESGYIKLDKIQNTNGVIKYTITLYGGLGSFFYGLSYDSEGNPLTLASLNYGTSLSFPITAQSVADAWRTLLGNSNIAKWQVINFAPTYDGHPDDFAADKVVLKAADAGLQTSVTEDGKTYTTADGYVLAKLARKYTAWEMQDLRCYLQRPVLSVRKMIDAICNPANNGGYTVSLDPVFFNENNPYYTSLWMTLPTFASLPESPESTTTETVNFVGDYRYDKITAYDVIESGSFGNEASIQASSTIRVELPTNTPTKWYLSSRSANPYTGYGYLEIQTFVMVQYVAMAGGTIIGGTPVRMFQTPLTGAASPIWGPEDVARMVDYVPAYPSAGYENVVHTGEFDLVAGLEAEFSARITDSINAENITALRCVVTLVRIETSTDRNGNVNGYNPSIDFAQVFSSQTDINTGTVVPFTLVADVTFTQRGAASVRNGMTITQSMLLNSEKTPAQYLISYCKLFGLTFLADKEGKQIQILSRNSLYNNPQIIDLTARVDVGQEITITPFVFDSKYYNMGYKEVKGQYAKVYKDTYNSDYGDMKINTGYDFNAEMKELLTDNAYNGAVEVLEKSKAFVNITNAGKVVPAAFLDGGEYDLIDAEGDTLAVPIPVPNRSSALNYFNADYPTYDLYSKAQFHAAENKPEDIADVLLFMQGVADVSVKYPSLRVTDDSGQMITLNDGDSCWTWRAPAIRVTRLPMFGRYMWNNEGAVTHSLDFGTPKEIDMPVVTLSEDAAIYPRFWRAYISDRYNVDAKVMTAFVDLSGLVVNRNLLRRFFYYEGAIWVLNKINNYSITTHDRTQCEFVKVVEVENYTNGLNI